MKLDAMDLFRLHAHAVLPQRTAEKPETPNGGAVPISAQLRAVMQVNAEDAAFASQPLVDFVTDPTTRTNNVRNAIVDFAFGENPTAGSAAVFLAERLTNAMDRRSLACLFVPCAMRDGDARRVILWIFPRDDAFRLRARSGTAAIEILENVFSQKSRHRKGAMFEGLHDRTSFLGGRVLDHQANQVSRDIADFWIARFLDCALSIQDEAGTRLLAKAVKAAFDSCEAPEAREQVYAAAVAMRTSPHRRISLESFANRHLEGAARDAFLRAAPNDDSRRSLFNFQREAFDRVLHFRVFQLNSGVFVSSPLEQVGDTVRIRPGRIRRLSCEGEIVDEKMRTQHG